MADRADQQMTHIIDRVKNLEVQERGTTGAAPSEWQPNHVILGGWDDVTGNVERLSQVEKLCSPCCRPACRRST